MPVTSPRASHADPLLPPDLADQDPKRQLRTIAEVIAEILEGHFALTGDLTLTANAASTVKTDNRVGPKSLVLLMPKTANAAAALGTTYISVTTGSFTVTHANNAQTDRTFRYIVIGQ